MQLIPVVCQTAGPQISSGWHRILLKFTSDRQDMTDSLRRNDWWPTAERLDLRDGQRHRIEHCCGPGRTILVSCHHDKVSAYCFRCDASDVVFKQISTAERIANLQNSARNEKAVEYGRLPDDFTKELPDGARLWLWKASLLPSEWDEMGIGYSTSMRRVILPVRDTAGRLMGCQARAIYPGQTPKYLNTSKSCMYLRQGRDPSTLIICEDMLSAARCGRHVHGAAICGVSMDLTDLSFCTQYRNVAVWLDPDRAGINGAAKILRKLQLINPNARTISSRADPKNLPDAELLAKIREAFP